MHLYKKARERNVDDVSDQLRRASGNIKKGGGVPHGFAAAVSFDVGDLYVDDELFDLMSAKLERELELCISRLVKGDYGNVSEDERDENEESRWLGDGSLTAKYSISLGEITVNKLCGKTEILLTKTV